MEDVLEMESSDFTELGMTTADIFRLTEAARSPHSLALPPSITNEMTEVLEGDTPRQEVQQPTLSSLLMATDLTK